MRVLVTLALLLAAVPLISADYDAPVTQINLDLPPVQASGLRVPCIAQQLSDPQLDVVFGYCLAPLPSRASDCFCLHYTEVASCY